MIKEKHYKAEQRYLCLMECYITQWLCHKGNLRIVVFLTTANLILYTHASIVVDVHVEHLDPSSIASPPGNKISHNVELDNLMVQCPTHTTERALIRKIDWKLLPTLCVIYMMAILDR